MLFLGPWIMFGIESKMMDIPFCACLCHEEILELSHIKQQL